MCTHRPSDFVLDSLDVLDNFDLNLDLFLPVKLKHIQAIQNTIGRPRSTHDPNSIINIIYKKMSPKKRKEEEMSPKIKYSYLRRLTGKKIELRDPGRGQHGPHITEKMASKSLPSSDTEFLLYSLAI